MGQEIETHRFTERDFEAFSDRLNRETRLLRELADGGRLSSHRPVAGFELEAWLLDDNLAPAPLNQAFLEHMGEPEVSAELALFNLELNNEPVELTAGALGRLEAGVDAIWRHAQDTAKTIGARLITIGILPTLEPKHLSQRYMTPMKRYRALNEQVLRLREGRPLRLNIVGREHLAGEHGDVMLESAATSFQIHMQVPAEQAHLYYNASIVASAPLIACGANSPYLFGQDLWDETRIPLFEQAVETGGFEGVARGPLRRVSFGNGYVRESIVECFERNLRHYPVLLPTRFETPDSRFSHLRLHNGTIWRWNRPLVGFDDDGNPHVRIEHRILPGNPSVPDAIANAALFYGLAVALCMPTDELAERLPFACARDNFYQAARFGLDAKIDWIDGHRVGVRNLLADKLIPLAHEGLDRLGIDAAEARRYLGIVAERVASGRNGCAWQREFTERHGRDMRKLLSGYLERQTEGAPVHEWRT
ncbi:MAG: glutamate--cysteine ligase [Pseudomonadota bacterium]|nr:glutamate--cysteine ligase [Pseudomonadota bacterium]